MVGKDSRKAPPHSGDDPQTPGHTLTEGARVEIPISDLDLDHGPYCTSFGRDETALRTSIQRAGVLNPPLVHRQGEGAWAVVAGFSRLRALRDLGERACSCRDLSGSGLTALNLLLLGLHENLGTRDLNPVEKAMALARLEPLVLKDDLEKTYLPLLGLPRRHGTIEDHLALNHAEVEVRLAVASGRLCLRAFRMLRTWSSADRIEITRWIHTLKYNTNKQLQLIDIISDLMDEKCVTAHSLLETGPMADILEQAGGNPPQAAARLLRALRRLRFPSLSAAEQAFHRSVTALELPRGVSVTHPAHFEGVEYRLDIRFRNGRDLVDTLDALARTSGLEALGPPWKGGD